MPSSSRLLKTGCSGWPVARSRYFARLPTVEIVSSFYNLPRLSTAERWRAEAPEGFEFSLKAWQLVTHLSTSSTYARLTSPPGPKTLARCGHFRPTAEVEEAWEATRALAETLDARFILFQTAAGFYPNDVHLRDMYRFFKGLRRPRARLAWEPRGESWETRLVGKVCADLDLVPAGDPLHADLPPARVRYFRLHGGRDRGRPVPQYAYSQAELGRLRELCSDGREPCYVFFNNAAMWDDANRFNDIVSGIAEGPYARRSRA